MHGRLFFAFITRPKQAVGTGNGLRARSGAVDIVLLRPGAECA